ncbi:HI_0552 family protein [Neisseria shayeganii]|uniref:Glucose-6-phosphate 1-dehydrogenase n=1 Tax=Neisseria shayeganii 871 TaxID=1032488 RepID=G4CEU9_9NEIS|nr:HI_0552 family protein [Neisseria shayeganii]EGY53684.1 glucose-6-phosphate 1-dehydrogenase [Neisseria shayeganii 871]
MLTPESCDLFRQPFFQFAQLKQHCPERIPQIKADYRAAWLVWQALIREVSAGLGMPFAEPHIERWCNGWQVRAHFFAYFKYAQHRDSAAIFSVLLNRRRLSVSLDWHSHKAAASMLTLAQYRRWTSALPVFCRRPEHAGFEVWRGSDSEYADHPDLAQYLAAASAEPDGADFLRIGRHLERAALQQTKSAPWIIESIRALQPLYEACYTAEDG